MSLSIRAPRVSHSGVSVGILAALALAFSACSSAPEGSPNGRAAFDDQSPFAYAVAAPNPFAVTVPTDDAIPAPVIAREYPLSVLAALRAPWFGGPDEGGTSSAPGPDETTIAYHQLFTLLKRMLGDAAFAHPDAGLALVVDDPADGGRPRALSLRTTGAGHAAAARLFAALEAIPENRLVRIDIRFIAMSAKAAGSLVAKTHWLAPDARHAIITPEEVGRLRRRIQASPPTDAALISAPRLAVLPVQRGSMSIANEKAYVADYDIEEMAGVLIADPIIGTVRSGVMLDTLVVLTGDDLVLTFSMHLSAVRELVELHSVIGGEGSAPVTIQMPDLVDTSLEFTGPIPAGHTLLLLALQREGEAADPRLMLVMVTPTVGPAVPDDD